jgi:hypothetical protein
MATQAFFIGWPAQAGDDGLSLAEIVDSLPTDPASIFVILLMAGFFGLILYFGIIRAGGGGGEGQGGDPPAKEKPRVGQGEGTGRKGA